MSVHLEPIKMIEADLGIQESGPVHAFFTQTCYRYMDKYVPMDEGNLRTMVDVTTDKIIYESPYARYQYKGEREDGTHKINPDNYTTPGTGPYWDKRMMSADMDSVLKEVKDYVKKNGG